MKDLLSNFKSSLIIQTTSPLNPPSSLDYTSEILITPSLYAIQNDKILVEYSLSFKLSLARLKPFSKIKEIIVKDSINDLVFVNNHLIYISDKVLCISNKEETRKIHGDYKDRKLIKIGGYLGIINSNDSGGCKGFKDEERDSTVKDSNLSFSNQLTSLPPSTQPTLILPHSLIIYDLPSLLTKTPVRIKEIKASLSFYSDNILLTSLGHSLSIYSNLNQIASISLPMIPTCLCTDLLFTKIYCGTKTGTILCINFDGSTNKLLDFHKNEILKLSFSFCNQYLYSLDSKGLICIWDVKGNVVIDKMEIEGAVNFDSVLLGNVSSSNGVNKDDMKSSLDTYDLEMPSIFN
ncbi:hypothetical protein NBO_1267g0003 [Nosema bombycis CQ1]|uniref:Uncharacterized protein n=1 Tax=Nosema bombycis (strain CQ1 / CVCC 102059) TaxID=578461 RepID=R0MBG0_NOSB1|nr:hypothetical protein NBO_1267g0003 [Nosema bombycis CQ1]|eukprot:EOB11350.1 hypothetical protein NBO_1267g0003 [Nosema bombycis CQ1]